VFRPESAGSSAGRAWLFRCCTCGSTKWKGVLSFNVSARRKIMTAFIHYHPKPTAEAGNRAIFAAAVGVVLMIVAFVAGSAAV
jgi:hypothetical protein